MARLRGKNLVVMHDVGGVYRPIGLSTACTIDIDTEMVEMASGSSVFRTFRPGRHNVTIQCDRLMNDSYIGGDYNPWLNLQINRTKVAFRIATVEDGTPYGHSWAGEAYVSRQSVSGQVDGYATHNVTLQVTGEITNTNASAATETMEEQL